MTAGIVVAWLAVRWVLRKMEDVLHQRASTRTVWTEKAVSILLGAAVFVAVAGVWFDDPAHLATFSGLVLGGVAFASQKLFQSLAGFLMIAFGRVFNFGDRIELGGVRGDVLDIGLLKTTVMEMGVPHSQQPNPNHWISARQYSGRVVTLANSVVFEEPVFNYSRNFDFLWEELQLPIKYDADLALAQKILVDAARELTEDIAKEAENQLRALRNRVLLADATVEPTVYVRLTDNWVELSLRFVCRPHGIRELKDKMWRRVFEALQQHHIEVASSTFAVVGLPELRVTTEEQRGTA
ncbi:MAG TPA: mechanosensitive ion channel family protein [Myxococcales bacterium]